MGAILERGCHGPQGGFGIRKEGRGKIQFGVKYKFEL